jgi:putative NADPH-quinone reductase
MNVFVVLAHPEAKSFNGALFDPSTTPWEVHPAKSGHTRTAAEFPVTRHLTWRALDA